MARKDIATKKYMRNPRRFADFFNGFIYGGKQVIDWSTLEEVDSELAKYINDYEINLFSIIDAEGFPDYKTELRELFLLLNTRNDKTKMTRLIQSDAEFSHINQETAELMREFASLKLPRKSKDGEYDMCKAVEDMKKESEAKGVDLVSDVFARLVAGESKESILESGVAAEIIDKAESMIKMVKP